MIERRGIIGIAAGLAMIPGAAQAKAAPSPMPYSSLTGCETTTFQGGAREQCRTFDVTETGKLILRKIETKTQQSETEVRHHAEIKITSSETDTKFFNRRHKLIREIDKRAVREVVESTFVDCTDDATGETYACSTSEQQAEFQCHQDNGAWIEQSTTDAQGYNLGVCRITPPQVGTPPARPGMSGPPVPPNY